MIAGIAKKITDNMVANETILAEDRELYEYGLHQGIIMIINWLTAAVVGLLLGMFWQSVMLLVFFTPVRIYAGGYHAKTQGICYVFSTLTQGVALYLLKCFPFSLTAGVIVLIISATCLWFLAPVEAENKPLEEGEGKKYKTKAVIHWCVEVLLWIGLTVFGFCSLADCILMSSAMVSMLLVLGELSNRRRMRAIKS